MAGRFTGMRHVHVKQGMVTRTSKLVNAGIIPKEPEWLKIMKRLPPQVPGPSTGKPPKIVLPTDKLYRIRDARFKAGRNMPYYAHGEMQSQAMVFAQRQWMLMRDGNVSEKEAYATVEKLEEDAKKYALSQVRDLTAAVKAHEGADVPLLLRQSVPPTQAVPGMTPTTAESPDARAALERVMGQLGAKHAAANAEASDSSSTVMSQLAAWKQKMADEPYKQWTLGQQVMLDHWVCKVCLSWGWEQERYLYDEEFEHELEELRSALFPELARGGGEDDEEGEDEGLSVEELEAAQAAEEAAQAARKELDALVKSVDWNDPLLSDQVNEWYVSFGKWQTKVMQSQGHYSEWSDEDKDGLDEWILKECLPPSAVKGLSDQAAATVLSQARAQLLPNLRLGPPEEAGEGEEAEDAVYDLVPELRDVRRIIAVKKQEADLLLSSSSSSVDSAPGDVVAEQQQQQPNEGEEKPASLAYTRALGLEAIRLLEEKGLEMMAVTATTGSSSSSSSLSSSLPRPGLFSGLVQELDENDDDDEYDDDDEDFDEEDDDEEDGEEWSAAAAAAAFANKDLSSKAQNRALSAEIKRRWAEEEAVVAEARRDERWKQRETAREQLILEAAVASDKEMRAKALAFALPELGVDPASGEPLKPAAAEAVEAAEAPTSGVEGSTELAK